MARAGANVHAQGPHREAALRRGTCGSAASESLEHYTCPEKLETLRNNWDEERVHGGGGEGWSAPHPATSVLARPAPGTEMMATSSVQRARYGNVIVMLSTTNKVPTAHGYEHSTMSCIE